MKAHEFMYCRHVHYFFKSAATSSLPVTGLPQKQSYLNLVERTCLRQFVYKDCLYFVSNNLNSHGWLCITNAFPPISFPKSGVNGPTLILSSMGLSVSLMNIKLYFPFHSHHLDLQDMNTDKNPLKGIEALTFDVFGTVVDWHGSVVRAMKLRAQESQSQELKSLSDEGSNPQINIFSQKLTRSRL